MRRTVLSYCLYTDHWVTIETAWNQLDAALKHQRWLWQLYGSIYYHLDSVCHCHIWAGMVTVAGSAGSSIRVSTVTSLHLPHTLISDLLSPGTPHVQYTELIWLYWLPFQHLYADVSPICRCVSYMPMCLLYADVSSICRCVSYMPMCLWVFYAQINNQLISIYFVTEVY